MTRKASVAIDQRLEGENPPASPIALNLPASASTRYLQHFSKRAMACDFEVFFNLNESDQAADAAMSAFELIDHLESQLSIYQDESEITQLNAEASHGFIAQSNLIELLQTSKTLHLETNGAFDITSTPLSKVWGFFRRNGAIPPQEKIDEALQCVDASAIQIDANENRVSFQKSNLEINLNSIGKGYALDEAASEIFAFGAVNFVIHGGQSSVVARGESTFEADELESVSDGGSGSESNGWNVGLSHPFTPDHRLGQITLRDQALGTSGTARQGFFHQGRRFGHVIDPRTGWPTDHFLSTSVITSSAATADALATAFFVMSIDEVQAYCDQNPEVAAIVLIPRSNSSLVTIETFNIPDETFEIYV